MIYYQTREICATPTLLKLIYLAYLNILYNIAMKVNNYDVIIIGAGAAGLMCAIRAGQRGLSVLVIDHAEKIGKKILISGGGRCNFTNLGITPAAYISPNPHFCKSALSRYTQWHFIEMLSDYGLTYHEKTLGQLFCDQKSAAVVEMLVSQARQYGATLATGEAIEAIEATSNNHHRYRVHTTTLTATAKNVVIACGGPSFPNVGASDFALRIAKQFGIKNTPFSPALVPLTLPELLLTQCKPLAGVSHFCRLTCNGVAFSENILFTHRGLSGPAVLQISSYWKKGDSVQIDLFPDSDQYDALKAAKAQHPQWLLSKYLSQHLPNKLALAFVEWFFDDAPLQSLSDKTLSDIATQLQQWSIQPSGSEGMKKAEVSIGGVYPDALSSKTFECKTQSGLYFIGEAVDVTGWLGGYNFQWAWSSGWCCGDSLTDTTL